MFGLASYGILLCVPACRHVVSDGCNLIEGPLETLRVSWYSGWVVFGRSVVEE
jgi:hypothetical protein